MRLLTTRAALSDPPVRDTGGGAQRKYRERKIERECVRENESERKMREKRKRER